jgi:hypothetical protein
MSIGSLSVEKPEIGQVFRDAWIGEDLLVQGLGRALPYLSRDKKTLAVDCEGCEW